MKCDYKYYQCIFKKSKYILICHMSLAPPTQRESEGGRAGKKQAEIQSTTHKIKVRFIVKQQTSHIHQNRPS